MSINYLYLQSSLHQSATLRERAEGLFASVTKTSGTAFNGTDSVSCLRDEPLSLVYVATGGTAGLLKAALPFLREPVVLVTSGSDNSLSASMEMLTFIKQQGKQGRILHGDAQRIATDLQSLTAAAQARFALRGMRLGMVGKPSDWLISSETDYQALQKTTGAIVIDIPMTELLGEIEQKAYPESAYTKQLLESGFNRAEVEKALHIYGALHRIASRHQLTGMSVRCFDLLTAVKSTGCLGAALLNAQGIYCGCEGDFPSLLSMVILGTISKRPVFQCNPSRIDADRNEIVFAHCTLPLNMPSRYSLDTHFESDLGVAVAGDIPLGAATIFKASGSLSRHFVSAAQIKADLHERDLCRSQILMQPVRSVEEFLNNPIGNHYLVCCGDVSQAVNDFFTML